MNGQRTFTDNTICFPIIDSNLKLLAILELSNSDTFFSDADEQYFIRLVSQFLPMIFSKIIYNNDLKNEIK